MANPPHFLTTKILLLFPTLASWQYKRKHIHRKCQKMLQNLGRRLLPGYMISCSWRSSNLSLQPSSAETSQKTPSWRSSETPWLGPLPSSLFPSPPPSLTPQIFFFKPAMFSNMLSVKEDAGWNWGNVKSTSSEYVIQGKSMIGLILFLKEKQPSHKISFPCILARGKHNEIVSIQLFFHQWEPPG